MGAEINVIKTTLPKMIREFEITNFSQTLLDSGAACVSYSIVSSAYYWEGEMISEEEWAIEVKVAVAKIDVILEKIKEIHPYDIPQILVSKYKSSIDYFEWVAKNSVRN